MQKESDNEKDHANMIEDYMVKRGTHPKHLDLKFEKPTWKVPHDVFKAAYEKECEYRDLIEKIVKLAAKEEDYLTKE